MTVDITWGKLVTEKYDEEDGGEEYQTVDWPDMPTEQDGTDKAMTIYAGQPYRSCSIHGFYEWLHRMPKAGALYRHVKRQHPNTQDPEWAAVDDEFMALVNALPDSNNPIDRDRVQFMRYWARRTREVFGSAAMIMFD